MDTKQILQTALDLAGLKTCPGDSAVLVEGKQIKKVLAGVDMGTAEILLAKELGVDCVLGHHPVGGTTRTNFIQVMDRQIETMTKFGVPINKAQKVLAKKKGEVDRSGHGRNYDQAASAARLLKMPLVSIHMPTDILAERTVQAKLDAVYQDNPQSTLQDFIDALMTIPEYRNTLSQPVIRVGNKDSYSGKPAVLMAGGTNGGVDVIKAYFEAGMGTTITMHIPEDVIKAVREQNIGNVIVAGHMASDSIGINQLIAALEAKGVEVIRMSGIVDPT